MNTWGGKRAGAGRPKAATRQREITVSLPTGLVDALDQLAVARGISRSKALADVLAFVDLRVLARVQGGHEPIV